MGNLESDPFDPWTRPPQKRIFLTIAFLLAAVGHVIGAAQDQNVRVVYLTLPGTKPGKPCQFEIVRIPQGGSACDT
jgi:hypothetical protein